MNLQFVKYYSLLRFGCPGLEELESYSQEYKKRLDETGALGNIPDDLAFEVIADRLCYPSLLYKNDYLVVSAHLWLHTLKP